MYKQAKLINALAKESGEKQRHISPLIPAGKDRKELNSHTDNGREAEALELTKFLIKVLRRRTSIVTDTVSGSRRK